MRLAIRLAPGAQSPPPRKIERTPDIRTAGFILQLFQHLVNLVSIDSLFREAHADAAAGSAAPMERCRPGRRIVGVIQQSGPQVTLDQRIDQYGAFGRVVIIRLCGTPYAPQ